MRAPSPVWIPPTTIAFERTQTQLPRGGAAGTGSAIGLADGNANRQVHIPADSCPRVHHDRPEVAQVKSRADFSALGNLIAVIERVVFQQQAADSISEPGGYARSRPVVSRGPKPEPVSEGRNPEAGSPESRAVAAALIPMKIIEDCIPEGHRRWLETSGQAAAIGGYVPLVQRDRSSPHTYNWSDMGPPSPGQQRLDGIVRKTHGMKGTWVLVGPVGFEPTTNGL